VRIAVWFEAVLRMRPGGRRASMLQDSLSVESRASQSGATAKDVLRACDVYRAGRAVGAQHAAQVCIDM